MIAARCRSFARIPAALTGLLALSLIGCGLGEPAGPAVIPMAGIVGSVYGGGIPIYKGRVRLFLTNTGATGATYGSTTAATEVSQAPAVYTDSYGAFSINAGYTCTTGQYAYVTITGGDAGGGTLYGGTFTINNNSVQMAALGSCSQVGSPTVGTGTGNNSTVRVYVSELSTVAAAYALSNFIGEDSGHLGDGDQRIYVNAPPLNNGTPTCTVSSNVTTACQGNGLGHAFDNAANLVHAVQYNSVMPSGAANTGLDGTNSVGSNSSAIVPQAVLNTLADLDETCVNTNGGAATNGTTNDGSACGLLFSYTTIGSNTPPSDTLMALVNLAKQPKGYGGTSVSNIWGLMPKAGAGFSPYLSAAPNDFSVQIMYPNYVGTAFVAPTTLALDAIGNVYMADAQGAAVGTATYSLSNNGTNRWAYVTTPTILGTSTTTIPGQMATDTLSHIWVSNFSSANSASFRILCITPAGAACTNITTGTTNTTAGSTLGGQYPYAVAVDRSNNVFASRNTASGSGSAINRYPPATYARTDFAGNIAAATKSIAIDSAQNLWATVPASNSFFYVSKAATNWGTPSSVTALATGGTVPGGVAVDNSQNAIFADVSYVSYVTPTLASTTNYITGITSSTSTSAVGASPTWNAVDGSGVSWYGGTSSAIEAAKSTGNLFSIAPCVATAAGPSCASSSTGAGQNPQQIAIDDAGTMWVVYNGASGKGMGIGEIIGTASPSWSQLSWGYPGVCPGNTTVYSGGCK